MQIINLNLRKIGTKDVLDELSTVEPVFIKSVLMGTNEVIISGRALQLKEDDVLKFCYLEQKLTQTQEPEGSQKCKS
jgi:hypothetical protein